MKSKIASAILILAGTTSIASNCFAQSSAAIKCNSKVPADVIAGCTAIINAGTESPQHLAMAYSYRGNVYNDQHQYAKAISDFSNTIRLAPSPVGYFNRGVAYGVSNQLDKAIDDFTHAVTLNPKYARAYLDRGRIYQMKGDTANAEKDFAMAKSLGM
ncbi:tetratricopeptide repeat protein [Bradyrhizobium erythrophlei]|uniref:tetratricopeptide repeat protein n=1 Tax=Bradyrhizobium erythrophlei TaxID=1437360 RepID=UPI0035ED35A2